MKARGRLGDRGIGAGCAPIDPTTVLGQLQDLLSASDCPADAVAVGGSKRDESDDIHSDLDLFVFCGDGALGACIGYFSSWVMEIAPDAVRHGPFLRDGFGLAYRFARGASFPIELFLMFESAWSAHPAAAKSRFIFAPGVEGQKWVNRSRELAGRPAQAEYICDYIANTFFAYLEKITKYDERGELAGAAYYFLKASSILISARLSLECDAIFDPDFAIRKVRQIDANSIRASADTLILSALQRCGPDLSVLIGEAASVMRQLDALCDRKLETQLETWETQLDARPRGADHE